MRESKSVWQWQTSLIGIPSLARIAESQRKQRKRKTRKKANEDKWCLRMADKPELSCNEFTSAIER